MVWRTSFSIPVQGGSDWANRHQHLFKGDFTFKLMEQTQIPDFQCQSHPETFIAAELTTRQDCLHRVFYLRLGCNTHLFEEFAYISV